MYAKSAFLDLDQVKSYVYKKFVPTWFLASTNLSDINIKKYKSKR